MSPKNPSNADIYRKLDSMDIRITSLESWKIAEDAAKKAIQDYKSGEVSSKRRKILNNLYILLAALTLLVDLIIQHYKRWYV